MSLRTFRGILPGDDVGQGDLLEHVAQAGPDGDPDELQMLGGALVDGRFGTLPADLGERAVNRADDVGDGDAVGRLGQLEPAGGAAHACDQA